MLSAVSDTIEEPKLRIRGLTRAITVDTSKLSPLFFRCCRTWIIEEDASRRTKLITWNLHQAFLGTFCSLLIRHLTSAHFFAFLSLRMHPDGIHYYELECFC